MKTTAIIVAGGQGARLKSRVPKAFVRLAGRPMVEYSLDAYQAADKVSEIILVKPATHRQNLSYLFDRYPKLAAIVPGGRERPDSVKAGLAAVSGKTGIVLIHDAARPLIEPRSIAAVISAAQRHGAAILAAPVTDTIKRARRGRVAGTVDRSDLWRAQTPQGFTVAALSTAHRRHNRKHATDDSQLAEAAGIAVFIVPGPDRNLKITTQDDLEIATCLLRKKRNG